MTRARRFSLAVPAVAVAWVAASPVARGDAPALHLVKGPYVTMFSDTSADIRYEVDLPGPTTLEIGPEKSALPARKIADAGTGTMHVVHVTGLEPQKVFAYGILSGTQVLATGNFVTAGKPAGDTPARFVVFGDSRSDPSTHAAIVKGIQTTRADFLVNTGDIVADGGTAADWQSFFQIEAPLLREVPMFLAIGNHELSDDAAGASFARYFGFPDPSGTPKLYGTARVDAARFFFLNGMQDFDSGDERAWLESALKQADNEPGLVFRIVVVHQGPWSSGPHGPNPRLVAAHVPELLAAHHVDLVLSGHDHIYERGVSDSMKYVITGGAGAPLYKVSSTPPPTTRRAESAYNYVDMVVSRFDVTLEAHRIDGTLIEKCGFPKNGAWDCDVGAIPHAIVGPPPGGASSSAASPSYTTGVSPSASPASSAGSSSSRSHCSVALPGASVDGGSAFALALVAVGARRARRRRG